MNLENCDKKNNSVSESMSEESVMTFGTSKAKRERKLKLVLAIELCASLFVCLIIAMCINYSLATRDRVGYMLIDIASVFGTPSGLIIAGVIFGILAIIFIIIYIKKRKK
ncbi:MAG: hypothetical protein PHX51_03200 [Clostridia bacterium]|nr:hypothetical protein [Clostridia bacterium]